MDTFSNAKRRNLSPLQIASAVVGAMFLLTGLAGFIPGLTTSYSDLGFAGPDSHAHLLGIFQVSVLHNIVHILFGLAGLALARADRTARLFLLGGGAMYLLLVAYGLVIDRDSGANFVPLNVADNWLHLALGLGMVGLGLALSPRTRRTAT